MKFSQPHILPRKKKNIPPREKPIVHERVLRFAEIEDKKRRRSRFVKFALVVGLSLSALVGVVCLYSFFSVKHVVCMMESQTCDDQLTRVARTLLGKSMFSNIALSHPYLSVRTQRQWPNGVRVQFSKPQLLLTFTPTEDGIAPFSLTMTGVIVQFVGSGGSLPPIRDQRLEEKQIGDRVDDKTLSFYQSLLSVLSKLNSTQITAILVSDENTVTFSLDENTRAIADMTHIREQIQSLQMLLLSPVVDRKGKTIDLRFENPVVK